MLAGQLAGERLMVQVPHFPRGGDGLLIQPRRLLGLPHQACMFGRDEQELVPVVGGALLRPLARLLAVRGDLSQPLLALLRPRLRAPRGEDERAVQEVDGVVHRPGDELTALVRLIVGSERLLEVALEVENQGQEQVVPMDGELGVAPREALDDGLLPELLLQLRALAPCAPL
jgi:hypothetical protein